MFAMSAGPSVLSSGFKAGPVEEGAAGEAAREPARAHIPDIFRQS